MLKDLLLQCRSFVDAHQDPDDPYRDLFLLESLSEEIDRLDGIPAAAAPGFVMVPAEPTKQMLMAAAATPGIRAIDGAAQMHQLRGNPLDDAAFAEGGAMLQAWRAMIKAAPTPPTSQVWFQHHDQAMANINRAAIDMVAAVDEQHATQDVPLKYTVPWGALNDLRAALGLPHVAAPSTGAETKEWVSLTDEDRQRAFESQPDMLEGFMKKWGWLHFAKAIEAICREKNHAGGAPIEPA